ncbi:MAG TPA: hypothetical protein VKQ52_19555, partial [Puia sp.]|nr:hypothetical protein [Puia sp.]
VYPEGQFVLLYVRVSNRAQKDRKRPAGLRVEVLDRTGRHWEYSLRGQRALEESSGSQTPLDSYLDAHSSFETELVFDVPKDAKGLRARVDMGPGLLRSLLLPREREVVVLP